VKYCTTPTHAKYRVPAVAEVTLQDCVSFTLCAECAGATVRDVLTHDPNDPDDGPFSGEIRITPVAQDGEDHAAPG